MHCCIDDMCADSSVKKQVTVAVEAGGVSSAEPRLLDSEPRALTLDSTPQVAYRALNLDSTPHAVQIVLWDKMKLYAYSEMLSRSFGGGRPLLRRQSFQTLDAASSSVVFQHLVFHLESPASNVHERMDLDGSLLLLLLSLPHCKSISVKAQSTHTHTHT